MPDPEAYESENDFMEACVSTAMEEGREQDQAVAMCLEKWRNKSMAKAATHRYIAGRALRELLALLEDHTIPAALRSQLEDASDALRQTWADLEEEAGEVADLARAVEGDELVLPMLLTKAEQMRDGRVRWQARANTGEWDLERERFDKSFWDDVCHNFSAVQEAVTKGEVPELPVPILDIAHYSFRLPPEKRNLARAGYPIKLWQDGRALMAQGFFDDTPLGRAAAVAAQARPVEDRRVSIGVWPDWGRVELDAEGRRIYKGGRNRAYLDHLAMTGSPVDPGTVLEVKSMTQRQDALDVLGADAQPLVDELEAATVKAVPSAAVVKAEECDCTECSCAEEKAKPPAKPAEAEAVDLPEPEKTLTMRELKQLLSALFETFGKSLDERLAPIEATTSQIPEIKARVDALGATETEKVKAAIDSGGGWWEQLVKNSVQRRQAAPVEGQRPQEAIDTSDPFYKVFGGLKPKT